MPFGGVIVGSNEFIQRFNRNKKMLGGDLGSIECYSRMILSSYKNSIKECSTDN